jgi:hypothetical protein
MSWRFDRPVWGESVGVDFKNADVRSGSHDYLNSDHVAVLTDHIYLNALSEILKK